jgi:hypothetical protein
MWYAACIPFLIHSLGMLADEGWFHRRRALPRWERLGHPLDTLTVMICYALALSRPASQGNLPVYLAAAVFSTLFITKDEWVHARACSGGEMWLHACLFALHPVLLGLVGLFTIGIGLESPGRAFFAAFLAGQAAVTGLFLGYQLLYWNGPWKPALPPPQ